jgi:hypothetical protein
MVMLGLADVKAADLLEVELIFLVGGYAAYGF